MPVSLLTFPILPDGIIIELFHNHTHSQRKNRTVMIFQNRCFFIIPPQFINPFFCSCDKCDTSQRSPLISTILPLPSVDIFVPQVLKEIAPSLIQEYLQG